MAAAQPVGMRLGDLLRARFEALLSRHWFQARPTWLARLLQPLAWLYGFLWTQLQRGAESTERLPVPVLVVGNFTVGGSGKTPAVIAIVQALQAAGQHPGVISRGHGRSTDEAQEVRPASIAEEVGDEPLLIFRRTGAPVWVGRDRSAAALALCQRHAEVNVLVSDDGLQHRHLPRQAELVVFDERGAGNGLLLPAGPLRQALPAQLGASTRVLYTAGVQSTGLPGLMAQRHIAMAWPLRAWLGGDAGAAQPLATLRGRTVLAAAGMAAPEKFFAALAAAGLDIQRLALPDHYAFTHLPWAAQTRDVVVTEKDAVKIAPDRVGHTQVWVVPLDLRLPPGLVDDLISLLQLPSSPRVP